MRIKLLMSGECAELGEFKKGEDRFVPASLGELFVERGIAEQIRAKKTRPREVKDDGRD